jgi:3-hydroxyacyl-[acyl-carrier-protein] dehydratase
MVDRIVAYEPGSWIRARKLASRDEPHWRDRGAGFEMRPALVLEAVCQAGAWLLLLSSELSRRAALGTIAEVKFSGPVHPGDVIDLEGKLLAISEESAVFSGSAAVAGTTVLEASEILCVMLDAELLASTEDTRRTLSVLLGRHQ